MLSRSEIVLDPKIWFYLVVGNQNMLLNCFSIFSIHLRCLKLEFLASNDVPGTVF